MHGTRNHSIISWDYIHTYYKIMYIAHAYLGIILNNAFSWSSNISNSANRASKILNFLRCNLYKRLQAVKAFSYISLVHSLMKYACIVWDPYQITININYCRFNSVPNTLQSYIWPTLELRHKITRISLFLKIIYNSRSVHLSFFILQYYTNRQYHPLHMIISLYSHISISRQPFPMNY